MKCFAVTPDKWNLFHTVIFSVMTALLFSLGSDCLFKWPLSPFGLNAQLQIFYEVLSFSHIPTAYILQQVTNLRQCPGTLSALICRMS